MAYLCDTRHQYKDHILCCFEKVRKLTATPRSPDTQVSQDDDDVVPDGIAGGHLQLPRHGRHTLLGHRLLLEAEFTCSEGEIITIIHRFYIALLSALEHSLLRSCI